MTPPIIPFAIRLSEIIRGWQAAEAVVYTKITREVDDPQSWTAHYVILSKKGVVKNAGYGGIYDHRTARLINDLIELEHETGIQAEMIVTRNNALSLLIWHQDPSGKPLFHHHKPDQAAQAEEVSA